VGGDMWGKRRKVGVRMLRWREGRVSGIARETYLLHSRDEVMPAEKRKSERYIDLPHVRGNQSP